MDSLDLLIASGYSCLEAGNLDLAFQVFSEALRLDPGNPNACCGNSSIALANNQVKRAISDLTIAIQSGRANQAVLSNLADIASCHPDEKVEILDFFKSEAVPLSNFLVFLEILAGKEEEKLSLKPAMDSLEFAISLAPTDQDILARLGLLHIRNGNNEVGSNYILNATAMDPSRSIIRYYQAKALYLLGDYPQSLEAFLDYYGSTVFDERPVDVDSLISLCYLMNNDLDSSLSFSKRALANSPLDIGNLINASNAYRCLGEIDACIECCQNALKVASESSYSGEAIHAFYNLMFAYGMKGISSLEESLRISGTFWESFGIDNELSSHYAMLRDKDIKKLKVGVLTVEIGDHVVSLFLESFLVNYPKERIHVDLILGANRLEDRARLLSSYVDSCVNISGKSLRESRRIIAEQGYDIIIDTSGVTSDSRLAILAHRCAPIQCHYIGYHATTGLRSIDYIIADDVYVPPAIESQFVEKILRIETPWIARPVPANLPLASYQSKWPDQIVIASFNQSAKISNATLEYWSNILANIPSSTLVVKDRFSTSVRLQRRVMQYLNKFNISNSRIIFVAGTPRWEDHMRFYNFVDIVVDATPWSAATTAFDALAMGVPFIAICGAEASSRMSSSILKAANHPRWIAHSPSEYFQIAYDLYSDIDFYRAKRASLQEENLKSPAFDSHKLAANLTSLLTSIALPGKAFP